MTIESDLARMERLLAKATRGPWKAGRNDGCKKIKGAKSGDHKQAQHTQDRIHGRPRQREGRQGER